MYKMNHKWIYSPSDLTTFLESEFAAWMDRFAKEVPDSGIVPDPEDGLKKVLQKKGLSHERKTLEEFRVQGLRIKCIEKMDPSRALVETLTAMKSGFDVIYQGYVQRDPFAGYADFLVRVPGESDLGDFHYEAWDTKLASKLKSYFIIQLCAYSDMLESLQGRLPESFRVVLGSGEPQTLKVADYFYYYQDLVTRFLDFHQNFNPEHPPAPEKYHTFGKWTQHAEALMKEKDSLWQVANINFNQICNLERAGITTLHGLAAAPDRMIPKMSEEIFKNLRKQSQMQVQSLGKERPSYEVTTDGGKKGLWLLPAASPGDVFFDLEGFPLVDGGLEYLWGAAHLEHDTLCFKDFWAHSREEEKTAFENFIDWVHARWKSDSSMHIYHYAPYETTVIKCLMGRYASREEKVDDLLRHGVFVDLYQIVKQGLWLGAPSYSIKSVELIYRGKRSGEVKDGGASVEFYQAWLDHPDGKSWKDSAILRAIRDYNLDDCTSTYELVIWLRGLQREAAIPPATVRDFEKEEESEDQITRGAEDVSLKLALAAKVSTDPAAELLLHLLGFYSREAKPMWWRFYDRLSKTDAELCEDEDCIGSLKKSKTPPESYKKSMLHFFEFDPAQETKIKEGDTCVMQHASDSKVQVHMLSRIQGILIIKVPTDVEVPERINLIPYQIINTNILRASIRALAEGWTFGSQNARATIRFLNGERPYIQGVKEGPLLSTTAQEDTQAIADLVHRMDHTTLCIQGPPGAGKTYLGKQLIASLVASGKTVGIVSNSHKAVNHLLIQSVRFCQEQSIDCHAVKVCNEPEEEITETVGIKTIKSGGQVPYGKDINLVGGTAWTFANEKARGQFDYLFIDEAGQVSLANFVAMGLCTSNIILFGDQMQLSQPTQGTHPGRSGESCLNFLLGEHATVPTDLGIFLGRTHRMHPEVCRYVSDMAYEGRLKAAPNNIRRVVRLPNEGVGLIKKEAGLVFIPVEHEGNSRASAEEVSIICQVVTELLGRDYTDEAGHVVGQISLSDILIIAPYNMQVIKIQEALPEAKVGSIDKFQGQEARVVILSMCSSLVSSGDSRGIEFLFSKNRLNVAISRAQSLAVVVANPGLRASVCKSVGSMHLINAFCQLMSYANSGSVTYDSQKKIA